MRSPTPFGLVQNCCWPSPGHSTHTNHSFIVLPSGRPQKGSLFQIGRLFFLFSCPSLARVSILLLLLMSGNVHPNPGPVFSCLVYAGNETQRGRSVQCYICSKSVHLRRSLLSFFRFETLGSSHFWTYSPCCVPASSKDPLSTNTTSFSLDFSILYTSTVLPGPSSPLY